MGRKLLSLEEAERSTMTSLARRGGTKRLSRGRAPLALGLALASLAAAAGPVRAESRTAESIWSQGDAEQRAVQQVPLKDRDGITDTRCQEVGVGRMGSLPRFRCTVWFTPSAGTEGAKGEQAPGR
jgi:hypothetical protein